MFYLFSFSGGWVDDDLLETSHGFYAKPPTRNRCLQKAFCRIFHVISSTSSDNSSQDISKGTFVVLLKPQIRNGSNISC
jgi:hypothetical protein